jgi:hypothetical protein
MVQYLAPSIFQLSDTLPENFTIGDQSYTNMPMEPRCEDTEILVFYVISYARSLNRNYNK